MSNGVKKVAVTGGSGQIAYSLLFRIAHGDMLGYDQPISLQILEVPAALDSLKGVVMELMDSAFPLLNDVHIGSNPLEVFQDVDYVLLIGAKPRQPGMERADLLKENGVIFKEQGRALNEVASANVKVLVVGNPCNTNCLIAMHNAPKIPRKSFQALTCLDQNRAISILASQLKEPVSAISNITIWGNHSSTMVPDISQAKDNGKSIHLDQGYLKNELCPTIQRRGDAILTARGKSSAASAASAIIDAVHSWITPTPPGKWFSAAICTDGNPYGISKDLIFSFPCTSDGSDLSIVPNLPWDAATQEKIATSEKELLKERELVADLL